MVEKEKVTGTVFNVIEEVNAQLPQESQIEKSIDTNLIGASGTLDSMGFVFLVAAAEQKITEEFGVKVTLTGDNDTFNDETPFRTVGTFIDHILNILNRENV